MPRQFITDLVLGAFAGGLFLHPLLNGGSLWLGTATAAAVMIGLLFVTIEPVWPDDTDRGSEATVAFANIGTRSWSDGVFPAVYDLAFGLSVPCLLFGLSYVQDNTVLPLLGGIVLYFAWLRFHPKLSHKDNEGGTDSEASDDREEPETECPEENQVTEPISPVDDVLTIQTGPDEAVIHDADPPEATWETSRE